MLRFLYSILMTLALPFFFIRLLWKSRRLPAYRRHWKERLGFPPFQLQNCIWIHAVSLGETLAAIPLIQALQKAYPDAAFCITHITPTGRACVENTFGQHIKHCYLPYDTPFAVQAFLNHLQPRIGIIMETECWPNLFAACHRKNIPLMITNARLSTRSAQRYQWIQPMAQQMLASVTHIAAISEADAKRYIDLGISPDKVTVTGNVKYDLSIPDRIEKTGKDMRAAWGQDRFCWIAASTHPGEEEIILSAHQLLLKKFPSALLVLVPRHPERRAAIEALLKAQCLTYVKRSDHGIVIPTTQVYLGDTVGELLALYAGADIVFMGGSLMPIGGHNYAEPALLKKTLLTGPSVFNFSEMSQQLIKNDALIIIQTAETLENTLEFYFQNPEKRLQKGMNAFNVIQANRGALSRQLACIQAVLSQ